MTIELTLAARERMRDFLARHPGVVGVRFGVRRTGCSGYGYTVDLAEIIDDGDTVLEIDGVRLVVDDKSLPFIDGTTIDYVKNGLGANFVYANPNATGECGCGESFTIDSIALT